LSRTFPFLAQSKVLQDGPNTLTILALSPIALSETVKISFFGGIDFGRVGTPQLTDDGVLEVASLADLMATKLKVVLSEARGKGL
jgi:hypothetical protein